LAQDPEADAGQQGQNREEQRREYRRAVDDFFKQVFPGASKSV
jgi:hypothetical protein